MFRKKSDTEDLIKIVVSRENARLKGYSAYGQPARDTDTLTVSFKVAPGFNAQGKELKAKIKEL